VKALVVDDDAVLADLVAFTLRREGFQVVQAHDGKSALQRWSEEKPDILLLDVNLPKSVPAMDGFAICRQIRSESEVPIILLTVRGDEEDIIFGLNAGADDYITKPFSPRQLVARVQAVLRRSARTSGAAALQFGQIVLDPDRREVVIDNRPPVALTSLENRLLETLLLHPGHILTNQELIDQVWGPGGADRDMLRQLVRRLRTKIEPDPSQPAFIETVPGRGYGLRRSLSKEEPSS
jgi:DNA-binding response OmpR family regulator